MSIKDFLHQTLAGYVADSNENKYVPLTIKHLPTLMILTILVTYRITYKLRMYSRTSIIRTPVCHFNVKGVQISEFVRISELRKYTV